MQSLDKFADRTIKESFAGKIFTIKKTYGDEKISQFLLISQVILVGLLFFSLTLPQFSQNRLGIGLIIILCSISSLFFMLTGKNKSFSFNLIDLLIILLLLSVIISTFHSYFFKESLTGLFKYILFIAAYFIFRITLSNSSHNVFIGLWKLLFIFATLVAIIGCYQYMTDVEPLATWEDPKMGSTHTRVYSTLGNPNLLAGYLLIFLPFGLFFTYKSSSYKRFVYLLSTLIIFLCIIFTGSRGSYIALLGGCIVSYFVFLVYSYKNNKRFLPIVLYSSAVCALILSLIFMFPIFKERIITILELKNYSSNAFRFFVWSSCFEMLKDNFIFGIGPGSSTFFKAYSLYMTSSYHALSSYNIFLEIALQLGILGLLTFFLIFLTSFLKLHHLFWGRDEKFALPIFCSIVFLIVHGMFDTVLFRPQIFIPFWLLLSSIDKLGVYKR